MRRRLLFGWGLAATASLRAQDVASVRMPAPPLPLPEHRQFLRDLLKLTLRKAGWPDRVSLLPTQTWMRQIRELREGHVDVSPLPALQAEVYAAYGLLRVDFALRGGLLGVRRVITLQRRAPALAAVRSLDQLQRDFTLGYGADWGDLDILQKLGFRLKTAPTPEALYAMLRRGEVDYLSRGVNEVQQELAVYGRAEPRIAVVPGLVLHYPLDDCFFVTPTRPELHEALSHGLQRAQADGSYADLLTRHYADELAQLAGARVLPVAGYPQPPGLKPAQFELWRPALTATPEPARRGRTLPQRVVMAAGQNADDPRFHYATALLQLALERAGVRAEVVPRGQLSQPRQVIELSRGGLDVGQLPSTGAVSSGQAVPVPFPIRRGLLGVRLLLAHRDRAERIAQAPTLEALQHDFVLGHGADWGDLGLMRQSGFRVRTGDSYPGLFRMLEAGRFDFMSRAVSEVWDELALPGLSGGGQLVVVPRLALFYPLDDFFWVNPARPELAAQIERGLHLAREDGSFDRLFRLQYGTALRRAQLRQRQVFHLPGIEPPAGAKPQLYDAMERFAAQSARGSHAVRVG